MVITGLDLEDTCLELGFEFTLLIQPDANSHHIYGRSSVNDLQSNILESIGAWTYLLKTIMGFIVRVITFQFRPTRLTLNDLTSVPGIQGVNGI